MTGVPTQNQDQPEILSGLVKILAVHSKCSYIHFNLCGQRGLCSDWANANADMSHRWAQM